MIKLTIGTTIQRKEAIVENNKTINQTLDANNISQSGTTFHLDGVPLTTDEMSKPIGDLVDSEEAMLIAVIAQKAGC